MTQLVQSGTRIACAVTQRGAGANMSVDVAASTGDAAMVVAMTLALSAGSEIPVDQGDPIIH